jgi:hypothetical protein
MKGSRRRKSSLRLLVAAPVVVGTSGSIMIATAARASATPDPCAPPRGDDQTDYIVGWSTLGSPTGVLADVLNYGSYVYPSIHGGAHDSSSAWVMLANTAGAPFHDYAQVGWDKVYVGPGSYTFTTFTEWAGPTGTFDNQLGANLTGGSSDDYKVDYLGSSGFAFYVGSTEIQTAPNVFTPNIAINAGEIHTLASQMPGNYSDPEDFSSVDMDQGGWKALNGTRDIVPISGENYFNFAIYSSQHAQEDDKACTG